MRIWALFFLLIVCLPSFAQLEIYKTLSDYKNNTPVSYVLDGEIRPYNSGLVFKTKDGKHNITTDEFWGFKYNNILFRTCIGNKAMAALISAGKICYWEDGEYVLDGINNKTFNQPDISWKCNCDAVYLSQTIESELYYRDFHPFISLDTSYIRLSECVFNGMPEKNQKSLKPMNKIMKLGGEGPTAMLNYVSRITYFIDVLRKCVKDFNAAE